MTDTDGVKLETLTINSATPDVLSGIMKKITDSVMKQIPQECIDKIAKQSIDNGNILIGRKGYSNDTPVYYDMSLETGKMVSKSIDEAIKNSVNEFIRTDEFRKHMSSLVKIGIEEAVKQAPKIAYEYFVINIINSMTGHAISSDRATNVQFSQDDFAQNKIDEVISLLKQNDPNFYVQPINPNITY